MKTKNSFVWERHFTGHSVALAGIEIPAGAKVEKKDGVFYVVPSFFKAGTIEHHDAVYYGCKVNPENVID